jgi:hypothetical protein
MEPDEDNDLVKVAGDGVVEVLPLVVSLSTILPLHVIFQPGI